MTQSREELVALNLIGYYLASGVQQSVKEGILASASGTLVYANDPDGDEEYVVEVSMAHLGSGPMNIIRNTYRLHLELIKQEPDPWPSE